MSDPTSYRPYAIRFWFTYAANVLLMIAVSIMFRYADFVTYLGGTEYELGWIVGVGMVGAIVMRIFQGIGIDRYGAGRIWIASLVMVCGSLLLHLQVDRIDSWLVYAIRILYTTGLAGAFGSSITLVSQRAPAGRTAEIIGALGSSGFVGMAAGPVIGDWLMASTGDGYLLVRRLFLSAACMSLLSIFCASLAVWRAAGRRPMRRTVPLVGVLRRYQPGAMLMVAMAMGLGIGIPFSFLRPFAAHLGIDQIRSFFLVYATVAFVVRIAFRRLPDRWGIRRSVLLGLGCLCASMVSYVFVRGVWSMTIPAAIGGVAHAFVFPAAVAGGSLSFPLRYRGMATTLVLMMFDAGNLLGQPTVGSIVHLADQADWPAYPTMFIAVATFLGLVALFYAYRSRER